MAFNPNQPWNGLPLIPSDRIVESESVLRKCIGTARALAVLDPLSRRLPDPTLWGTIFSLLEAQDSSELDQVSTTTDALFRQGSYPSCDPPIAATLQIRDLLVAPFLDSPGTIAGLLNRGKIIEENEKAIFDTDTHECLYTPPNNQTVIDSLLADFDAGLREKRFSDPLIQWAILAGQWELIRPYGTVSGRVGRLIGSHFARRSELLSFPGWWSRHILEHHLEFSRALQRAAEGDWQPWVHFFLESRRISAERMADKMNRTLPLYIQTKDLIRRKAPKMDADSLTRAIFHHPYCRISDLSEGIAKRQTASLYLKKLAEIGILQERREGRDKFFVNGRFFSLLVSPENTIEPFPENLACEKV